MGAGATESPRVWRRPILWQAEASAPSPSPTVAACKTKPAQFFFPTVPVPPLVLAAQCLAALFSAHHLHVRPVRVRAVHVRTARVRDVRARRHARQTLRRRRRGNAETARRAL